MFRFLTRLNTGRKISQSNLSRETLFAVSRTLQQFVGYTIDEFGRYGLIGEQEITALEAYEEGAVHGILPSAYTSVSDINRQDIDIVISIYAEMVCSDPAHVFHYAKIGVEITPHKKVNRIRVACKAVPEFQRLGLEQGRNLIRHYQGDSVEPDYHALRRALKPNSKPIPRLDFS